MIIIEKIKDIFKIIFKYIALFLYVPVLLIGYSFAVGIRLGRKDPKSPVAVKKARVTKKEKLEKKLNILNSKI